MLPIIVKDLRENLKTWSVFALLAVISILLSAIFSQSPERQNMVEGFICSVVLASALIFTHSVVVAERRRRHFVFLKSLPVDNRQIVQAKFIAVALLTGSLGNIPFLLLVSMGSVPSLAHWFLANGLLIFYSSLLLYFSLRFQSPAILFLPLYLLIGLVLLPESSLIEVEAFLSAVLRMPILVLALSSCAAMLFLFLSIRTFRLKELDF